MRLQVCNFLKYSHLQQIKRICFANSITLFQICLMGKNSSVDITPKMREKKRVDSYINQIFDCNELWIILLNELSGPRTVAQLDVAICDFKFVNPRQR